MAKTKEEIRERWNALKDIYEQKEATSIELEESYASLVSKIRRSKPKNVLKRPESETFGKLAELWEQIRLAHIDERNAKYDADIYTKKALKKGAISEDEVKKDDPFNNRGVYSQENLGISRGAFNPVFADDATMTPYIRELLEGELAGWADITPAEARQHFVEAAQPSDSDLTFDQRCIEIFQTLGKKWKKDRVFIDLETTALDPYLGEIIEIGIVRVNPEGEVVETFDERFDLERADVRDILGVGATHIHHIAPEDVVGKRKFSDPDVQKELGRILNDPEVVIVPHHAAFEHSHLSQQLDGYHATHVKESGESLRRRAKTYENGTPAVSTTDTRVLCTYLMRSARNTLEEFATTNGVDQEEYTETAHGAYADADMTFRALWNFRKKMQKLPKGQRVISPKFKPKRDDKP